MTEDFQPLIAVPSEEWAKKKEQWRRGCGCIKTSDKLREILLSFPTAPPPPPPSPPMSYLTTGPYNRPVVMSTCMACHNHAHPFPYEGESLKNSSEDSVGDAKMSQPTSRLYGSWAAAGRLVGLLQLSVTATALAMYYLIYCYMQLVYFTLKSALYFHNADGAMKITIGVITITCVVLGFNVLMRMERMVGYS